MITALSTAFDAPRPGAVERLKSSLPPISAHVPNLRPKTSKELAGPCPFCGGTDRFIYWPETNSFLCRNCKPGGGDAIDFFCKAEGTDISGLKDKYLKNSNQTVRQTETGRYQYHDAEGKPLYYKVRVEPGREGRSKDFYFYHGNNEKGRGCLAVLYNLLNVIKANVVFITEGEKKADILNKWGFVATTLDSGSNSKLTDEMIQQLKGKHIIILPDNDIPGRKYKDMLVNALDGKAASIKVINLPGLPEKGDIVNWVAAGGTKAELLELVEGARPNDSSLNSLALSDDDFILKDWPVLNSKALYGLAGVAVELATRNSEADPAAVLYQFICFLGAKCGNGVKFYVGDTVHYPRLFVAVIGNSSKSRKGTSAQPVKRLFKSESDMVRISPGPLSSGEGIIDAVRDKIEEYQLIDKKSQIGAWVTTDPGVTDKRLIILDEELASALASMNRAGNTLSTIIRCMWDSGTCAPLTKTTRTRCTDAHVVISTHSTFQELKEKLQNCEHVNGFANRFLWVLARRQKLVPRPLPMPEEELEAVKAQIEKAYQYSQGIERLYFDDDTWKLWDIVYPELSKDHPGFVGAIINRGEAQVVRLSMIYALMDCSDKIKPVHLEAALAAWEYCRASASYIFGDREEDNLTQRIVDILEEGPKTATDISDAFHRHIKSSRIKSALEEMVARGRVQASQEKTKGRTKTTFSLSEHEKSEKSEESITTSTLNSLNSLNSHSLQNKTNYYSEEDHVDL